MTYQTDKNSPVIRTRIKVAAGIFVIFILYYLIMAIAGQESKISSINKEFGYNPEKKNNTDLHFYNDSSFFQLTSEKAFTLSRIAMAGTDSLSLSLNLEDSTASLEIKGVSVHIAKIEKFAISKVFTKADRYAVISLLSAPFNITGGISSIKKEPVMLKIAPKDTSEYKPDIIPDTTMSVNVNYLLESDGGFRIYVYGRGMEKESRLSFFLFDLSDRLRTSRDILRSVILLKTPDYHPYVKIWIDKADARIIYRGLPKKGQVAVHI